MTDDTTIIDRVEPDPMLSGEEKETTIALEGMADRAAIYSAKPTVVRSLLDHDHFEETWIRTENGRFDDRDRAAGDVYAARGTIPVGCLTVKSAPRSNNHHSSIVNSETIDPDAFNDD